MSGRGLGWAKRQDAPDRDTKALLVFLGDYLQDTPFVWPAVSTVAGELQVSERTVQRMLPQLLEAGLLIGFEVADKATGRHRTRAYFFPIDSDLPTAAEIRAFELNAGCVLRQLRLVGDAWKADVGAVWEGDSIVTPSEGSAAVSVTGEGDHTVTGGVTAVSPLKEHLSELSDADASSTGAGASEAVEFDQAWAAYPELGRLGASSERMGRRAWADELAGGASAARLLAGIVAYAGNRAVWGASGRPKAFHRFLSDGCWADFAEAKLADGGASPAAAVWSGPAEIRERLAALKGEGFVGNCLDRAAWDGAAIVPRTGWARDQLRAALKGTEIVVLDPVKAGVG